MANNEFREELDPQSSVNKVIGIVSGKGGVGKSLVTSLMAVKAMSKGFRVGIIDADITGPSIPKAFGLSGKLGVTYDQLMIKYFLSNKKDLHEAGRMISIIALSKQ